MRYLVLFCPQVEGRGAFTFVGKRIMHCLGCAVRWFRRIAFAIGGSRARQPQEGGAPGRIAPRIGHHGAVPFVKDLLMTGLALSGAALLLPVIVVGRRG